jgi:chromosome segregation ATPase
MARTKQTARNLTDSGSQRPGPERKVARMTASNGRGHAGTVTGRMEGSPEVDIEVESSDEEVTYVSSGSESDPDLEEVVRETKKASEVVLETYRDLEVAQEELCELRDAVKEMRQELKKGWNEVEETRRELEELRREVQEARGRGEGSSTRTIKRSREPSTSQSPQAGKIQRRGSTSM